jgi:hypothetical protein
VTQAIRCGDGHEDSRAPAYAGFLALDDVCAQAAGAQAGDCAEADHS